MMHTAYFPAKIGFDTAENEASKIICIYFLMAQILKHIPMVVLHAS